MTKRKRYSAEFKAKVALEAVREELTTAELDKKDDIHPTMITGWKRTAIENMASSFDGAPAHRRFPLVRSEAACQDRSAGCGTGLFVRSLQSDSLHWRLKAVKQDHPDLSLRRQCSLLSLVRSGFYYQPRGESAENLKFMAIIDRQFLGRRGMVHGKWPVTCNGRGTDAGGIGSVG